MQRYAGPLLLLVLLAFPLLLFAWWEEVETQPELVDWSVVVGRVEAGEVSKVAIHAESVVADLKTADERGRPEQIVAARLPGVDDAPFVAKLEEAGVAYSGVSAPTPMWPMLLWLVPPLLIFFLFRATLGRMSAGGSSGALTFGSSKAKIYDKSREKKVTFADVAGVEEAEAELVEVVSFLKDPAKYRSLGAKIPKGVLLVGPPGTGKTLMAKAVAGEAEVPFFSLSGSEFVEMFVGVGAARIRDLFQQARERAPCIVFIDELDAIGKSRGGIASMSANEEREQTLNQLLVEMDGFDPDAGVVIMAATNRPEILDPALVRPGRFDRQVLVDRPDVTGREEILAVHLRRLQLAPDVNVRVIAQRTPGMVGADLANLVNEAALAAARRGAKVVEQRDFEEAVDRLQLGLKKHGRVMNDDEKRRVAFHESGHALVALSVAHADPVHRVSIIPRSIGALGVTLQLPTEDRYLVTREELLDRICVMLGGRAAEELVCGDVSTGAANDLERATETARQMVTRWGMSETLGPATWGRDTSLRFLPGFSSERDFSEATARAIDDEVRGIVEAQRKRALGILQQRGEELRAIGEKLLEVETLERGDLEALARPSAVA